MDAITMGQRSHIDEPILALAAAVFRQAAMDYRFAVNWLMSHQDKEETREYKEVVKLRNDVVRFTKSKLFGIALGDKITPDKFLKMALKGFIVQNKST